METTARRGSIPDRAAGCPSASAPRAPPLRETCPLRSALRRDSRYAIPSLRATRGRAERYGPHSATSIATTYSSPLQNLPYRRRHQLPADFFFVQLLAPSRGDFIQPRAPLIFRSDPARLDPARFLHAMQRRIERAFLYAQN